MGRKPQRRPVHYVTFSYRDGAVVSCHPTRKPTKKRLKSTGERIDEDLVCQEFLYGCDNFTEWPTENRVRTADLLANRLNMRRSLRELVLPELAALKASLVELDERLDRIETVLADLHRTSAAE